MFEILKGDEKKEFYKNGRREGDLFKKGKEGNCIQYEGRKGRKEVVGV